MIARLYGKSVLSTLLCCWLIPPAFLLGTACRYTWLKGVFMEKAARDHGKTTRGYTEWDRDNCVATMTTSCLVKKYEIYIC